MDIDILGKYRFEQEKMIDDNLQKLDDYMSCLTDIEKEAINSVVAKRNSYQETADYLGVSFRVMYKFFKKWCADEPFFSMIVLEKERCLYGSRNEESYK